MLYCACESFSVCLLEKVVKETNAIMNKKKKMGKKEPLGSRELPLNPKLEFCTVKVVRVVFCACMMRRLHSKQIQDFRKASFSVIKLAPEGKKNCKTK